MEVILKGEHYLYANDEKEILIYGPVFAPLTVTCINSKVQNFDPS